MDLLPENEPLSIPQLIAAKGRERIAMLTVYDAPSAGLLDAAGVDVLLVGDSVEMTVYGEPNTLTATMDTMIRHTRAVSRAVKRAVVVGDMPFLSYQAETGRAVENAGRFLAEGGAAAVKVQGREADSASEIVEDAKALAQAGCFAVVLECVPESLAAEITREIPIPTLGIGAGAACDGQVLVFHDVVGLSPNLRPKFVRRYADLSKAIGDAARAFTADVKSGSFPSKEESFTGARPPLRRVH
jgi:3-methyl-2-oxobutanoate hydroxymethyltransferase